LVVSADSVGEPGRPSEARARETESQPVSIASGWLAALDDFRNWLTSRSGEIWHFSPLFRLLPSSGYLEQMLRERSRGAMGLL
jgi:hypothetical protein